LPLKASLPPNKMAGRLFELRLDPAPKEIVFGVLRDLLLLPSETPQPLLLLPYARKRIPQAGKPLGCARRMDGRGLGW
jgi:hypothetical protein